MEDEATQRFEALQVRARRAVDAAKEARDRGASFTRVHHLVSELEHTAHELDGLRTAMHSRAVIEQAKGILMCLHGCAEAEAFDELVRISQSSQLKLREVAARLVAHVSTPGGTLPAPERMDLNQPPAAAG